MKPVTIFMSLSKVKGLGRKTLNEIDKKTISAISSINDLYELYKSLKDQNKRISECSIEEIAKYMDDSRIIIEESEKMNIKCLSKFDEEYPQMLLAIDSPPVVLFTQGNTNCLNEKAIAIIGTRNISPYGEKIGIRLGEYIAEKGFVVVSGFAEGCDTAGHTGCVNKNRPTVAIMATGLDTTYPKSNTIFREKVINAGGCLISEYPIGSKSSRYTFVDRDRLQAGMSLGVVVIETGIVGGTMHAVNAALKDSKPVACYQYDDLHYEKYEHSLGNKKMIQEKIVIPLVTGQDIDSFLSECTRNKDIKFDQPTLF